MDFEKLKETFDVSRQNDTEWVLKIRKEAYARFQKTGLPDVKDENWKYTSLRNLRQSSYDSSGRDDSLPKNKFERFFIQDADHVVFLNEHLIYKDESASYVQTLSNIVQDNKSESRSSYEKIRDILKTNSSIHTNSLIDLNEAFFSKGCFIEIEKLEKPRSLHVLHLFTKSESQAIFTRNLFHIHEGSKINIIESFIDVDLQFNKNLFINALSDFVLNKDAQCTYSKFQQGSKETTYLGHVRVDQRKDSHFYGFSHLSSSDLSRESLCIKLAEERAESYVRGIFHTKEKQHVDYSVFMTHAASYTKSRQLFKGVGEDASRGVFNAHIKVLPGLKKIDAHQVTKNLLLGANAEIDARPHLEIDSDDVKCAHGAAVGRLRADEVFYLEARGIPRPKAEKILSAAFTEEVILDIPDEEYRNLLVNHENNLREFLSQKRFDAL